MHFIRYAHVSLINIIFFISNLKDYALSAAVHLNIPYLYILYQLLWKLKRMKRNVSEI